MEKQSKVRILISLGILWVMVSARTSGGPCKNPLAKCDEEPGAQHGAYEYDRTASKYVGVKATLDKYDPQLCGDTAYKASSSWWVMLSDRNSDPDEWNFIQTGWIKQFSPAEDPKEEKREAPALTGQVMRFAEEWNSSEGLDVKWRLVVWNASPGAIICECVRQDVDAKGGNPNIYVMKAGDEKTLSRKFGCVFKMASFAGETKAAGNQMPGDKKNAASHVHFKDCKTRTVKDGRIQAYEDPAFKERSGGEEYGLTIMGNEMEIWDTRCPD